ncbi:MAG: NUDIX domain-containing protein, partial [Phycisphaerales bacterium]
MLRTGSQLPHERVRRGVIGIISSGPAYLVIRRAPGIPMGGYWCFPGGHVEPGETPRQAIKRELAEELGITVVPTERVGSVRVDAQYV